MSQFLSPAVVALALVSLNGATLALFGLDKMKAQAGARRIAESTLLGLALLVVSFLYNRFRDTIRQYI